MTNVTTQTELNGLYKKVYADKLENRIPDIAKLVKMIDFRDAKKLGDEYQMPIILSDEQGVTYAGPDEDCFNINDAVSMTSKPAKIKGYQIFMKSALGFKAAAAATAGGEAAFVNATELVLKRLMASLNKRLEVALLYGQSGLGKIDGFTNVSATSTTIDFVTGSFASGIWVGSQNALIDVYDSSNVLVVSNITVGKVDVANKKLTVSGASGDITALEAAITALTPPDYLNLFYLGAQGKEMKGLDSIITTNGLLFDIDNTVYDLHKGHVFDCGGAALTFNKLTQALVLAVNYGLEKNVKVIVSPATWQDLNNEEAALREYDQSYKAAKAEKGVNGIVYNHAGIQMEIHQHSLVKEGEAFIFDPSQMYRIGAYKQSMQIPGRGGEIFNYDMKKTCFEVGAYTDQALYAERVSHLVKIENIVNS